MSKFGVAMIYQRSMAFYKHFSSPGRHLERSLRDFGSPMWKILKSGIATAEDLEETTICQAYTAIMKIFRDGQRAPQFQRRSPSSYLLEKTAVFQACGQRAFWAKSSKTTTLNQYRLFNRSNTIPDPDRIFSVLHMFRRQCVGILE